MGNRRDSIARPWPAVNDGSLVLGKYWGRRRGALQRGLPHRPLERAERSQLLGRAPGHDAGPVALPAEARIDGTEPQPPQAFEELDRQPGEPGHGRHQERAGGARPQHGRGMPAGLPEQQIQEMVEGRRPGTGGIAAGGAGTGAPKATQAYSASSRAP